MLGKLGRWSRQSLVQLPVSLPVVLLTAVVLLAGCISARKDFTVPEPVDPDKQPLPTNVYEEMLASLDKADAYLKVKFEAGDISLDKTARLHLEENTEAGVWVVIEGGTVASARIEFTRRVGLEATAGVPMSFRHLRVTDNGEVEPTDLEFDLPAHRLLLSGELPKVRQLIAQRVRISTDLYAIFVEGKVFAPRIPPPQSAQGSGSSSLRVEQGPQGNREVAEPDTQTVASIDSETALALTSASTEEQTADGAFDVLQQPTTTETNVTGGLADRVIEVTARINEATLRQGSVLLLNDYGQRTAVRRTRLVIGPGSSAAIPYAQAIPRKKYVKAVIDLALTTLDSAIVTADRRFDFASGSKLIARKLEFEKEGATWSFRTQEGSGYAELALKGGDFAIEGSQLSLAPTGSSILLYSLDLTGSSSPSEPLQFSGAGRITLKVDGGNLHFNTLPGGIERAYLALDAGSQLVAEGKLRPVQWGTGAAWQISEGKARIDLNVNDGVFDLGPAGVVLCGPGTRLESAAIDFDTTKDRNFTGALDLLRVQDVRATLKGKSLASRLKLDQDSFLIIGDGSSLLLRDAVLDTQSSSLRASLSGTLAAIGGTLDFGQSHFVLADHGSRATFNNVQLDTKARRFVYGALDRISCVVQATRISSGKYIRDLSLAPGSTAILSPLVIDRDTGRATGKLLIDAQATNGGTLAIGPGDSIFPFKVGTSFRASDLTVDSDASAPVQGHVQSASISTEGGQIDLAALSHGEGGSGFVGVTGTVSFQDAVFPPTKEGPLGRAYFGSESSSTSVVFLGGRWDIGYATLRLREGRLRGPLTWEGKNGVTIFQFRPTELLAEIAATVAPINKRVGGDPKDVPCVLSTGELSISGAGSRFRLRADATALDGSFAAPLIRRAEGVVSIECLDSVSLDVALDGGIYIPCDGNAEQGGAKTYPQNIALAVTIGGGWRFAGTMAYNSDGTTKSLDLAQATSGDISVSILNKNTDKDEKPFVVIVDGREMNTVEIKDPVLDTTLYEEDYCDRVTVRWHKGFAWKAALSNARIGLSEERFTLSAELRIPEKLTVKKHDPSEAGLSWDGSPRVEDLDILGKLFDLGSVSEEINSVIDKKVLPAIKAQVSHVDFLFSK